MGGSNNGVGAGDVTCIIVVKCAGCVTCLKTEHQLERGMHSVVHDCSNIASYVHGSDKPMVCKSVCDFSLFIHNCTFPQMWIYVNCAILLFLSPLSSTSVGEGK